MLSVIAMLNEPGPVKVPSKKSYTVNEPADVIIEVDSELRPEQFA